MVLYGSNKYGFVWPFRLADNEVVLWQGDRCDWLVADREAIAALERRVGPDGVNGYLAGLLAEDATCSVGSLAPDICFSDL